MVINTYFCRQCTFQWRDTHESTTCHRCHSNSTDTSKPITVYRVSNDSRKTSYKEVAYFDSTTIRYACLFFVHNFCIS